ncbi:hypothetical protein HXX76_015422 [Chlamydomonas incerta]|uniref:CASTOR/POLLUX/SYM8 ion channel conserved domain-containing protein n=1 Tax=Chlamydomonas incerta TaxID=51695 RepID=A0A835SH23_CHLIN|nr:hypothetical protein HXX76_015422 [Chlamydomonas incerta]|eukprot:KAG2423273.1 hypothetical protein HXX76_015422 [Chlamydomonas incerta]
MQAMTLPTWGKILTVMAVALPILALGSAALCAFTGEQPLAAVKRCYFILNNVPGADIAGEEDVRAAVLLNTIYIVGLLTFAVLIGVLGDDIGSAVESARLGNSRVPERNHTVVLGHNRQLVDVLRQVAVVRADRGATAFPGQLVVLSERDRAELEAELVEALGPAAAAAVVTRQGSPLKVADLQRVSAGHARTVILLAPDEEGGGGEGAEAEAAEAEEGGSAHVLSAEAQQAVALAALHHLRQAALGSPGGGGLTGGAAQTVVVQQDSALDLLVHAWGSSEGAGASRLVASVSHLNNLARIQAQCAAQPGLSAVMGCIMQQQPGLPEFYVQSVPEVVGLTYGEARRLFPRAVLTGFYDPRRAAVEAGPGVPGGSAAHMTAEERLDAEAAAVVLNPPDASVILDRHSLILLADKADDIRPLSPAKAAAARAALEQEQLQQQAAAAGSSRSSHSANAVAKKAAAAAAVTSSGSALAVWGEWSEAAAGAPVKVVVLAFDGQSPEELVEALADYCPAGSQAVVVAAEDSEAGRGMKRSRAEQGQLRLSTVPGDPRTRAALSAAGVQGADAVILTGLDGVSSDQADAQALATLLQLQALMPHRHQLHHHFHLPLGGGGGADGAGGQGGQNAGAVRPLNVVCGVTDPRTREIMQSLVRVQGGGGGGGGGGGAAAGRPLSLDIINADEMLAGVLTQVAAEPRLSGVFHELSSAEGVEVYMRTPGALRLPLGAPIAWDTVQDSGREHNVTVIGVVRGSGVRAGAAAAPDHGPVVELGVPPGKAPALTLQSGDKLVVLAEEAR